MGANVAHLGRRREYMQGFEMPIEYAKTFAEVARESVY